MSLTINIIKIRKNGVVRPNQGTITGGVWTIADGLTDWEKNVPASRKLVVMDSVKEGVSEATATTQYGRWCKFNGFRPIREKRKKSTVLKTIGVDKTKWNVFTSLCKSAGIRHTDLLRSLIDSVNSGSIKIN